MSRLGVMSITWRGREGDLSAGGGYRTHANTHPVNTGVKFTEVLIIILVYLLILACVFVKESSLTSSRPFLLVLSLRCPLDFKKMRQFP